MRVKEHTLRYYEQIGLVVPKRDELATYQANLNLIEKKIAFYEKNREPGFDKNLFEKFVEDQQT